MGTLLVMGISGVLWIQSTFVAGADWADVQYRQANEEVLYLQDKQQRLENQQPPQQLEYEDSRRLQRSIEERNYWKEQIKK